MPVATNSAELEKMIIDELRIAMQEIQVKAKEDMLRETMDFYSQGNPSLYTRTGQLGRSPNVTPLYVGTNSSTFTAYLKPGSYTVPNPVFTEKGLPSYFSPLQILTASEHGTSGVKGKGGFWQRANANMLKDADVILARHFN